MQDQLPRMRDHLQVTLACFAASLVIGAAYTSVTPQLSAYAPIPLNGILFTVITGVSTILLGIGIGHKRPRAVLVAAAAVSLLSSAFYGIMLALPTFSPDARNIIGVVNYALTQSTVTLIIVSFIVFPSALIGLLASYFWYYR